MVRLRGMYVFDKAPQAVHVRWTHGGRKAWKSRYQDSAGWWMKERKNTLTFGEILDTAAANLYGDEEVFQLDILWNKS